MKQLEILKIALTANTDYFLARRTIRFINDRTEESVLLISLPHTIKRRLLPEEITLEHLEQFDRLNIDFNLFLDRDYAPFQTGISWSEFSEIYPLTQDISIKEFMIKALSATKTHFYDYTQLVKDLEKGENAL